MVADGVLPVTGREAEEVLGPVTREDVLPCPGPVVIDPSPPSRRKELSRPGHDTL